jgi:hypothetical protein
MLNKVRVNVMVGQQECVGRNILSDILVDTNPICTDKIQSILTRPNKKNHKQEQINRLKESKTKPSHYFKLILLAQLFFHILCSFYIIVCITRISHLLCFNNTSFTSHYTTIRKICINTIRD